MLGWAHWNYIKFFGNRKLESLGYRTAFLHAETFTRYGRLIELSFTSHSTQNRSFWRRSPQPISWRSTEETKPNTTKANTQKLHLNLKKTTLNFKNCSHVCVPLCTTVIHNTAQNSSDDFPSYPPDNHHCSSLLPAGGDRDRFGRTPTCDRRTDTGHSIYRASIASRGKKGEVRISKNHRSSGKPNVVASTKIKKNIAIAISIFCHGWL